MSNASKKIQPREDARNRKYFEFLLVYPPFREDVWEIRKELDIPPDGYTSNEEIEKWQEKQNQMTQEFEDSTEINKSLERISNNFKSGKIDRHTANKYSELVMTKCPINKFSGFIKGIIKRYKIPINFEMSLRVYILSNKISWIPMNNFGFKMEDNHLSLSIYSKLTKVEMTDLVKYIRTFNKSLPRILEIKDTVKAQLSIEESLSIGNKTGEKITAKDLAEEYFQGKNKEQRVYDSKRELNRKRKSIFG